MELNHKDQVLMREVSFLNLMTRRIFNVLIIANPYDAFMLEDDGRIEEKIFNEYMQLGLRYPPTFIKVSTIDEAAQVLEHTKVDLAICMPGLADNDAFDVARMVKNRFRELPCVVLTPFSHGITRRMENEDLSMFDYVFCWLGNTNLILSIIKLIEDRMNLEHDIKEAGVQVILLVEDSIRFYSSVLPNIYSYVLEQSQHFATEALNRQAATLRMRGRPKVVLARTYEEAQLIYDRYESNVMGVISDVRFPMFTGGEKNPEAGFKLLKYIRTRNKFVPLVVESSEVANRAKAEEMDITFVDKNSKKLSVDLGEIFDYSFGFGDFVIRDLQTHEEVMRITNLKDLQDNIFNIPSDLLIYHISRNHLSRWLSARALFPLAAFLRQLSWNDMQDIDAHRQLIFDGIVTYRRMKNLGTVAVFDKMRFDKYAHFARIGEGSLGGKGRGLAFLDNIIKSHPEFDQFKGVSVQIPMTVVLCTDIFDQFMEQNDLYHFALSDATDEDILQKFLEAQLPDSFADDFNTFIDATRCPLAVRSSSLLEDAHYQPFAGVYSTYMIPYLEDRGSMLAMLSCAIKSVYASVFYKDSKAYMTATSNVIDQEKMAVIIQQVVGKQHETRFYPNMSGVLRSLNYYPVGDEKAEEGIASLALGLGKYIVDGGQTLRISPYHPQQIMQLSEVDMALRDTQKHFYALDMSYVGRDFKVDDGFNIKKFRVKEADKDGVLRNIASTYDPQNDMVVDSIYEEGRRIISFAGVLKHGVMPLPEIMQMALQHGAESMRRPVEIEMAGNIEADGSGQIYLLQIRPIVDTKQNLDVDLMSIPEEECLLRTESSLGHGIIENIHDVVMVDCDLSHVDSTALVGELDRLNREFLQRGEGYILIGSGRWGSSDPYLGIPVKWANISQSRLICELLVEGRHIDPSQGTHFFQNLTSLGVGYFTIDSKDCKINECDFNVQNIAEHIKHYHTEKPLTIMLDGLHQTGVVVKNP